MNSTKMVSHKEYIQSSPCVAIRYFHEGDSTNVQYMGPELNYDQCVQDLYRADFSIADAQEYFKEHPDENLCFYILTKDNLSEMIERLEIMKEKMEGNV